VDPQGGIVPLQIRAVAWAKLTFSSTARSSRMRIARAFVRAVAAMVLGDSMEKLFISILNRTLLLGCLLLIAIAVILAIISGIDFLNAGKPAIDKGYVNVAYLPLTPLTPGEAAPGITENLSSQPTQEDIKLREQATPSCQALGRIAATISNKRLDYHGEGLTNCEKAQVETAKEFGSKAANYLIEAGNYFGDLANDPHLAIRFPDTGRDDQTRQTLDELSKDFESKFRAQVGAQNAKNESAVVEAAAQRLAGMTLLTVAGGAFLGFLYIAFLIVFLRIEKHLEKMSDNGPVHFA
jgi:hypothetical protein